MEDEKRKMNDGSAPSPQGVVVDSSRPPHNKCSPVGPRFFFFFYILISQKYQIFLLKGTERK